MLGKATSEISSKTNEAMKREAGDRSRWHQRLLQTCHLAETKRRVTYAQFKQHADALKLYMYSVEKSYTSDKSCCLLLVKKQ